MRRPPVCTADLLSALETLALSSVLLFPLPGFPEIRQGLPLGVWPQPPSQGVTQYQTLPAKRGWAPPPPFPVLPGCWRRVPMLRSGCGSETLADFVFPSPVSRIAMVPTDPCFTAQACGGDSSKNPVVTRPGLLALRKLGRNCYLHVWCVTGWPLRISGEGWAVPALDLCLWIEPFVLFPHTLPRVLGYRPSSPAPNAAAHASCHAGSEGRAPPQGGSVWVQPSPSRERGKCKALLPALGSFQVAWGFGPALWSCGEA